MIFKERQKRAMDTMNHRNKEYLEKMNGPLPDGGEENQEIPVRQVDDNPFSKDNLEKVICRLWSFQLCSPFYPLFLL